MGFDGYGIPESVKEIELSDGSDFPGLSTAKSKK